MIDQSYEELRQAALLMQVAVANVLLEGGVNIDSWWNQLVIAQQNLSVITHGSQEEFDKYRKKIKG